MELVSLARSDVLRTADVSESRERSRQTRLLRVAVGLSLVLLLVCAAQYFHWSRPSAPSWAGQYAPAMVMIVLLCLVLVVPLIGMGRSPHVLYRPEEIDTRLDDVKGAGIVVEEVVKTLNLFLAHKTFQEQMGGTPRRAVLFEGPPGTGKTYIAKAMAGEAGVPFLFVSSSAFQSMFYGQTNRKVRSYFKALRKHARQEGGAIGFIEEIDAIGASRSGLGGGGGREGIAGVVNELLIQLQSFDTPPAGVRLAGAVVDQLNRWLPPSRGLRKPSAPPANILVIGATNRAGDLDPALLRPGRFDRTITVDVPGRSGRREIIDYYLSRKSHDAELDREDLRETLAATTFGYSPVMIEHLFDEALVWALRRGAPALNWDDLQKAKMTEELGLAQPTTYAQRERLTIATHEAGHATVAWLASPERTLEVLSIIKRSAALGLLAHSDPEERFTRTRSEIESMIRIAMGGLAAEEAFFGESGTGVAGDLSAATGLAAQMVGSYGMAGSLISVDAAQTPGFTNVVAKVLGDEVCRAKVDAILESARDDARTMIESHRHLVEALRDALLEREELIGSEISDVLEAADTARHPQVIDLRQPDGEVKPIPSA